MARFLEAMVAIAVAIAMVIAVNGQGGQVPSCATKLVPCAAYLNSTAPPSSCCDSLKEAVSDELSCLCALFNDTALLKAFNIDIDKALQLPKHCGITQDQSICSNISSSSNSTAPTATPASPTTAGSSGGGSKTPSGSSGLMPCSLYSVLGLHVFHMILGIF